MTFHMTRISHDSYFAWQAQYLVMLNCHFSWQAQYSVKFGMIAGARNVVFFNRKCSWRARKVASVARRVAADGFLLGCCSDHARIILGSFSDRPRIGNDVSVMSHSSVKYYLKQVTVQYSSSSAK